jgi:ribosome-interacting GTPase 1
VDTPSLHHDYVDPALIELIRKADLILLVVDLQTDPIQQLEDTVDLLVEHRIIPCLWQDRYAGERRMTFIPFLILANKCDDEQYDENLEICHALLEEDWPLEDWPLLPVSAQTGRNLERLRQMVFEQLEIVRVYAKPPGEEPDLEAPFVLKRGSTVAELASQIHRDFVEQLKAARVWGSTVHDGQMVARDYVLEDGDVVELHV